MFDRYRKLFSWNHLLYLEVFFFLLTIHFLPNVTHSCRRQTGLLFGSRRLQLDWFCWFLCCFSGEVLFLQLLMSLSLVRHLDLNSLPFACQSPMCFLSEKNVQNIHHCRAHKVINNLLSKYVCGFLLFLSFFSVWFLYILVLQDEPPRSGTM